MAARTKTMRTRTTKTAQRSSAVASVNNPKSYVSLLYGIASVFILFVIIFLGMRLNANRAADKIAQDGVQTESQVQQNEAQKGQYTVLEGETLWSIAEKHYKSGYNWVEIAEANKITNASTLEKGTKLTIPEVTPKLLTVNTQEAAVAQPEVAQPQTTAQNKIEGTSYTVKQGDSLWDIAQRAYNDGYKWVEIARSNKLVSPDVIHTGNTLTLPRG